MADRNYAKELEELMRNPQNKGKTLFLHSCCAPCSSYVLMYLSSFFKITVFYYNPNITEDEEYLKRVEEQKRLITAYNEEKRGIYPIAVIEGEHEKERFFESVRGLEKCKEGTERCFACYELRLRETVKRAAMQRMDYVTTTLTISPLKNAGKLNEIGERLAEEYGVCWLPSDFKKKNGYQRSIELSKEYGLYRQDYCGCIYSKLEREKQKTARREAEGRRVI